MNSQLDQNEDNGRLRADEHKTPRELFAATLEGDYEDDLPWAAVQALRSQNTLEVFQHAKNFCESTNPLQRARGLDVLSQLGGGRPLSERPYFEDSVSIAIRHLTDEDALVVRSAAWALAHLADDRSISELIGVRASFDENVRQAVAVGLTGSERPEALQILMELMNDADDEVRSWATFGLGNQQPTADSPKIREALRERLADTFCEVRDEAIRGLALRRDPVGLQMLLGRFESDDWVSGDEITAAEILDLPFVPETPISDICSGLRLILRSSQDV